jgi:hypothetical protein
MNDYAQIFSALILNDCYNCKFLCTATRENDCYHKIEELTKIIIDMLEKKE